MNESVEAEHRKQQRGISMNESVKAEHRKQQEGQDEVQLCAMNTACAHTRKLQDLLRRAPRPKIVAAGRPGLGKNVRAPLAHPARQVAHIAVPDGRAAAREDAGSACAEPSQSASQSAHAVRSEAHHPPRRASRRSRPLGAALAAGGVG